ncbi:MAG: MoaD/ThiS family protein [Vicingaceae bacterium]
MNIQVKYFGQLAEIAGKAEETISLESGANIEWVKNMLLQKYSLQKAFFRIALNSKISEDENLEITDGDELAFFPPFAGG